MARAKTAELRRRVARLAAGRRLEELRLEEAMIRAVFPELFAASRTDTATASAASSRPRSTMSVARRQAVSERMKTYWAARRRTKNG